MPCDVLNLYKLVILHAPTIELCTTVPQLKLHVGFLVWIVMFRKEIPSVVWWHGGLVAASSY